MARGFRYGGGAGQLKFREKYRQPGATAPTVKEALGRVLDAMEADYKRKAEEKEQKAKQETKP